MESIKHLFKPQRDNEYYTNMKKKNVGNRHHKLCKKSDTS